MSSNDVNEQLLWEQIALKKQSISTLKSSINDKRKDVSSKKKLVNSLLSEIETARIENTPLIDEDAKWTQISTLKSEINTLITSIKSTREIIKEKENTVEDNIDLLQDNALEGVELPPPLEKVLSVSRLEVNDNTTIAGSLKINNNLNVSGDIYFDNSANLTNLIVNNNTNLNKLVVDNSANLSDLTVTNNTNLNELVVDNSANLTNLNVTNNTNLNKLVVDNSTNLTDLDVSNLTNLYNLNVTNKSYLKDISGTNLDISNNFKVNNKFNLADRFILDNCNNIIVKTNIIPDLSNVYTLGTLEKPFMDLFLGPSSLYINGTKVISADQAEEMKIETTTNQNLTIQTSGSGVFKLQSNADMNLNTVGVNSDINLSTNGGIKINSVLGLVFATNKGIKYQDDKIILSGDVVIDGSLNINGKQTVINTEALSIKDNIVILNSNQQLNPIVGFQSGFEVIRGNRPKYNFKFRDLGSDGGVFEVGEDEDLQPVVTRKDSQLMTDKGVLYWDNSNNRLDTFENIKFNNGNLDIINSSKLLIAGVDVLNNINTSLNNKLNLTGGTISGLLNTDGGLVVRNGDSSNQIKLTRNGTFTIGIGPQGNPDLLLTGGNVGIGRTNAVVSLDVSGGIRIQDNQALLRIQRTGESGSQGWLLGHTGSASNDFYIYGYNSGSGVGSIRMYTQATERFNISSNGSISISGDTRTTGSISLGNNSANFSPGFSRNWILINHGGYTSNIGSQHPLPQGGILFSALSSAQKLEHTYYMGIVKDIASSAGDSYRIDIGNMGTVDSVGSSGTNEIISPFVSVRGNGRVGIGKTNPDYTLDVNGAIKTNSRLFASIINRMFDIRQLKPSDIGGDTFSYGFGSFNNNNSAPYSDILHMSGWGDSSGGNKNALMISKSSLKIRLWQGSFSSIENYSNYADCVMANSSGNVGIGTDTPNYKLHVVGDIYASGDITGLSDIRFKENIINIDDCLNKVCKLRGVYYNIKGNNKRKVGMIAQEVEQQFPELVKSTEESKSLNYQNMVSVLVEAIKTLNEKYSKLEEKYNKLEKILL